ncbi:uncharacterized protein CCOS01_01036, partial [Colletotrichum costaricense]
WNSPSATAKSSTVFEQPPAAHRTPHRKPTRKAPDPKCPKSEGIQFRKTLHKHKRRLVSGFYGFFATQDCCPVTLEVDDCGVLSRCEERHCRVKPWATSRTNPSCPKGSHVVLLSTGSFLRGPRHLTGT